MKLLAFSDSHNRPERLLAAVAREQEDADACFFLGDGLYDVEKVQEAFPALPLYLAQGNCDPGSYEPFEGTAPFGSLLFFYTHGHQLHVKQDLDALWWRAHQRGADAALFGHTHIPYYECRNGIHLFNPGSITMPRFGPPTYGVITLGQGPPRFDIVPVER